MEKIMKILNRQEFDEYFKDFYVSYSVSDYYKQLMWNAYSLEPKYLKGQAKILLSSTDFLKYQLRIVLVDFKQRILNIIDPFFIPIIKYLNNKIRSQ